MLKLFDYIYYRIYRFFKEKGHGTPETVGSSLLSLMQFLTIVDIIFILELIYGFPIPSKFAFLPLLIALGAWNWYQYERNFDTKGYEMKWKDEEEKKKIKNGWLIAIYLLISFLFPIVLGILKHNLQII